MSLFLANCSVSTPSGSGGGGFDVTDDDAQAFVDAAEISDETMALAVDALVIGLKAESLWAKMTAIYPFVGGTAAKHAWNLKDPATYKITWVGTVTHNANGMTGDGTSGYGNTGLNASNVLSANNTHLSIYSRTSTDGGYDLVASNGSNITSLYVRQVGNFYGMMYSSGSTNAWTVFSNSNGQGFYIVSRRASNDMESYKNGSSVATQTNSAGSLPNAVFFVGAYNDAGTAIAYSNKNIAFASIGASLSDAEAAAFTTIVDDFQTALSRNV